jgi:hypothetical protein
MSVITYRNRNIAKHPTPPGRSDLAPVTFSMSTIFGPVRKAIAWAVQAHADARMQRAMIELEFYRNRYKHSSKNDDDLPIVR